MDDILQPFMAIIRPQRAEALCQALIELGWVANLSAVETLGSGRHLLETGNSEAGDLLPKVVVTGAFPEENKEEFIDAVLAAARLGRDGDGKLYIYPTAPAIDI